MSKSSCKQFEYYSDMGIPDKLKKPRRITSLGSEPRVSDLND